MRGGRGGGGMLRGPVGAVPESARGGTAWGGGGCESLSGVAIRGRPAPIGVTERTVIPCIEDHPKEPLRSCAASHSECSQEAMFSGAKTGSHWEKSAMCLLLATLLISGVVESLVLPMSATSGDDNAVSSSGGAEGGSFPYAYAVPPQCMTTPIHEMAPRMRRLCVAIATLSNLSGGMDRFYMDDKAMRDNGALLDSGVKRQDIDHVFLRFGRSR